MALSLNDLKKGREIKPPIIVSYGVHGIGKSTFASQAPAPVFIQTEESLNTLDVVKFPLAKSVNEVFEAIQVLAKEEHKFQTVVLDTIDWFEKLVHQEVRKVKGADIFTDYGKGYKFSIPYFETLIDGLTWLRNHKNMAIIIVGHAKTFSFNAPDLPAYDRYALDLHEGAATTIEEWAEIVLFANYRVFTTKEDQGFGKIENKATGKGDRVLYTTERPPFRAKNRYNLPPELPMSFAALKRAMDEGLKGMEKSLTPTPASVTDAGEVSSEKSKGGKKKADAPTPEAPAAAPAPVETPAATAA